ncbi:hypothetical protein [Streptomyces sp. NBC_00690]|uniref:hypothetical protein n=1 Tax=Streptomyces sp. NBC_00690 TaxID=2975808 RepID=UPI002E2952CC|nr:hypothetical protein [Streptomyces sp. NBC_00690]
MNCATGKSAPITEGELPELAGLVPVELLEGLPRSAVVEALLRKHRGEMAGGTAGPRTPRWQSAL